MATEGLGDVKLVTGSTAVVMDNGSGAQIVAPTLNNVQYLYDPVEAIKDTSDVNVPCWKDADVSDALRKNATILVYQSTESDERLGLVAV